MQWVTKEKTVTSSLWVAVYSLMIAGLVVGCSGRPKVAHSGFLRDYSQLKLEEDGAKRYLNPSKNLRQYNKFIIDPVVVHFAPKAKGTAIDPAKLKELSDYFRNQLVKGLSKRYRVVRSSGPGVLRIRIAITDIKKTTAVANIHPAMKMSGIGLGGAAMEAEVVDSVSGERVGAIVDSQSGGRLGITAGLKKYGHAEQVMDGWVERFVKRLDKAHGYKGK